MNTPTHTYIVETNGGFLIRIHPKYGACLAGFARESDIDNELAAMRYIDVRWTCKEIPWDRAVELARLEFLHAIVVHDGDRDDVHEIDW